MLRIDRDREERLPGRLEAPVRMAIHERRELRPEGQGVAIVGGLPVEAVGEGQERGSLIGVDASRPGPRPLG